MAFGGNPFLLVINENKLRLSGVFLAPGVSAVLAFTDFGGLGQIDVFLGKLQHWQTYQNQEGQAVFLHQAISVDISQRSPVVPISVIKAGIDHGTFQLVLRSEGAVQSGLLDITITYK